MKTTLLQTLILFIALTTSAQDYTYDWSAGLFDNILPNGVLITDITDPFNGVNQYPGGIAVDNTGNIISTGMIKGSFLDLATYFTEYETTGSTIYLQKHNSYGEMLWSKYIDGGNYNIPSAQRISKDIAIDNQNNIFICGTITDTTDFDPGPGESLVVPQTTFTGFIAKYSEGGDLVFVYLLQGGTDADPRHIAIDNNGNILVSGIFEGIVDFDSGSGEQLSSSNSNMDDNFLLKIDNSGQYVWHKTWGADLPDDPTGLEIDESGNIYLTCLFNEIVDTDPGPAINELVSGGSITTTNSYLSKFNSSGNFLWSTLFKSASNCSLFDLALKGSNIAVTGTNDSAVEISSDGSSHEITAVSPALGPNTFAVGLNANGQFVWNYNPQATLTAISSFGTEITSNGEEWFLSFVCTELTDLDNGVDIDTAQADFTAEYLVNLSGDGEYQWNKKFELDENGFISILDIKTNEKDIYLLGNYNDGALDANPDPTESNIHPGWFVPTAFTIKLSENNIDQNMCGEYRIGDSAEADFQTITEALNTIRSSEITCDITLIIEAGTYNETIDLSALNNEDFTITLLGEGSEITFVHPLDSIATDSSGISIINTNNIVLKNFALIMDDISDTKVNYLSNRTKGIGISNASNITLDSLVLSNSNFVASENTTEYIASAVSLLNVENVSITNSELSGAGILTSIHEFTDVHIENNKFKDGQFHIRSMLENYTSDSRGITITKNTFTGPFPTDRSASAIYLSSSATNQIHEAVIENNFIDGKDANPDDKSYGIFISGLIEPVLRNNKVKNGADGIFIRGIQDAMIEANEIMGTSNIALRMQNGNGYTVVNNILVSNDMAFTAMFLSNLNVVHNTFHAKGDLSGVYVLGASADSLVFINNIVSVANTIKNELDFNFLKASKIVIDYNLYSGNAAENTIKITDLGGNEGEAYSAATLEEWKGLQSEFDQNSKSFIPSFAGADDYHIIADIDYRFAFPLDEITKDFDGDDRIATYGIDVGADQSCISYDELVDITTCDSFFFNGILRTSSGQFKANFISELGCDSTVTLNLTILNPTHNIDVQTACKSYTWIDGNTYTESTDIPIHIIAGGAVNGCDSVVTLNLTVLEPASGTDFQTACNEYTWIDGITYTESTNSATYTIIGGAANGCDSIVTLDLTIGTLNLNISADGLNIKSDAENAGYQWLDCDNNMSPISGATDQTYTATANGNYAVEISGNGCKDTTRCITITTVGVFKNSLPDGFKVYPNPTTGEFTMEFNKHHHKLTIRILSLSGRILESFYIRNAENVHLNIDHPAGIYLVESVDSEGHRRISKLIKK